MTNEQIKVFNELLADDTFKGKPQLKHLLWLNTNKPKYKVGDCFVISDRGVKVFGYPVIDFKAKIDKVTAWKDKEEWYYHLTMYVVCGDKTLEVSAYKYENELLRAEQCSDNKNILGDKKSEHASTIDA